jgi:hypothetical protein
VNVPPASRQSTSVSREKINCAPRFSCPSMSVPAFPCLQIPGAEFCAHLCASLACSACFQIRRVECFLLSQLQLSALPCCFQIRGRNRAHIHPCRSSAKMPLPRFGHLRHPPPCNA